MSNFLLHKGCKVLQENKCSKKTKQPGKLRLGKKKNCLVLKKQQQEDFQINIYKNLRKLEQLSEVTSVDISQETLAKCTKNCDKYKETEDKEEETVFTEKDFEEFEKEYFGTNSVI